MKIKKKISEYFLHEDFKKKFSIMLLGVVFMGFFLSFLREVDLGLDPCSFMGTTVSGRLGILFGTWQVLMNLVLIIIVIIFGRHLIGPGTIANMVLIGYISDFCRWVWAKTIPEYIFKDWPYRIIVFIISLICFVIAASFYMNADMGVAPYDAIPIILSNRVIRQIPFKFIRIAFDASVVVIGLLLGGNIEICTILMVFLLGPMITAVGNFLNKKMLKVA